MLLINKGNKLDLLCNNSHPSLDSVFAVFIFNYKYKIMKIQCGEKIPIKNIIQNNCLLIE